MDKLVLWLLLWVVLFGAVVLLENATPAEAKSTHPVTVWKITPPEETQTVAAFDPEPFLSDGDETHANVPEKPNKMRESDYLYMLDLCARYGIDPAFVLAVIECESDFNQSVLSETQDIGLMQVHIPEYDYYALGVGRELNLMCPLDNLEAGMYELADLHHLYGDDYNRIAMAYNSGRYGAARLIKQGVYSTGYSRKVMRKYEEYKNSF